jgi:hypothetical protein
VAAKGQGDWRDQTKTKRKSMSPEEVWRSRCVGKGWRCAKCTVPLALSDAAVFFNTGLCERCSAARSAGT